MSRIRPTDDKVIRFHLRVIHGISVRECPSRKERCLVLSSRLFGVSLANVQRRFIPEYGLAKLNRGEGCLATALPYDLASLVKCFCRELPQALFPPELQESLLQAQALPTVPERTSALQLLSCLLPARNASLLLYLFTFLYQVSQRCDENLMTSRNLAVIFTPCLFPADVSKLSVQQIELCIDVLQTFIDNPRIFSVIPKVVMDSMAFLFGSCRVRDAPSKKKDKKRLSFQVPPTSEGHTQEPTASTSRPLKRSLGLESFPNVLLFRTYAPHLGQQQCDDAHGKDSFLTLQERLKRLARLARGVRGQDEGASPVLTSAGKLKRPTSWRRRSM
ncbi:hypothetical protein CRUP_012918 [Coryphaenoides rupestris]|nr:hypothetical protein CRUP_012918 [Coryphaenoides rupestris]